MSADALQPHLLSAPAGTAEPGTTRRGGWAAAGSVLGALAVSSCCIAPLVLFALGVSGAWIGNLTSLEPYQPISFAATAGFLGIGYYRVYRQSKAVCAGGSCARPAPRRLVKSALWASTLLVLAAVAFRYLGPFLLAA